ncbi:hypothetical protein PHYBLDRAFT_170466 [Phycomyces blakesleeanus NRRL 1555(-)]|uniref:Uncharacterized protein n=1 Tax=Phycomyces blakesleeanus (strain ATCC 8743b / DSM 1359 / FGSC 10004 / NBRC 33097 / NRRL 1555) TaxID=763407 RepID=A0A163A8Q0_PHYB8|nr:hypothetical protein PHYBLDRAFT_170466 [Phycomyces blakesleeanus NRRL 1555(-)]OAD71821.1 hypothetical protein PHYBLDRAFT_170466 [Phycomyces blakesleeanus NRRL 1555(-)]|eukprot:XP_018289861.1 hypothetical protein PHYBLDRAFT_170466 [Phycomyces blakesleeanus NRRL 1555(-)]
MKQENLCFLKRLQLMTIKSQRSARESSNSFRPQLSSDHTTYVVAVVVIVFIVVSDFTKLTNSLTSASIDKDKQSPLVVELVLKENHSPPNEILVDQKIALPNVAVLINLNLESDVICLSYTIIVKCRVYNTTIYKCFMACFTGCFNHVTFFSL